MRPPRPRLREAPDARTHRAWRHARATLALLTLAALTPAPARAGDKEICLTASEQGQRARVAGRLIDASSAFADCAREVCPRIVREACSTWQDEVERSLPTVSVGVRDADGRDVLKIRITVDGKPAPEHAEGRSFAVDPGMRVFRVEADGIAPLEERVLIKEGEKARTVNLQAPRAAPAGASASATSAAEPPPGNAPTAPASRSATPFVVAGIGAAVVGVGLGVHFAGKGQFPTNCRTDAASVPGRDGTCTPTTADPTGQVSSDAAVSATNLRNVGTGVAIGGAAVLLGGLVWVLVDTPTSPAPQTHARAGARLAPSASPTFAGVTWSGTF